jgi:hypothetical protein
MLEQLIPVKTGNLIPVRRFLCRNKDAAGMEGFQMK